MSDKAETIEEFLKKLKLTKTDSVDNFFNNLKTSENLDPTKQSLIDVLTALRLLTTIVIDAQLSKVHSSVADTIDVLLGKMGITGSSGIDVLFEELAVILGSPSILEKTKGQERWRVKYVTRVFEFAVHKLDRVKQLNIEHVELPEVDDDDV